MFAALVFDSVDYCFNPIRIRQIFLTDGPGQARSQKFAIGGAVLGVRGGDPGRRKPMGIWGRSPQPAEAQGSGGKPFSRRRHGSLGADGRGLGARKFCIFLQKYLDFSTILIKDNAFKSWHRNWQCNMIHLVALMAYVGSG